MIDRLKAEQGILGFPVTDHPLALFPNVRWDSYCGKSALIAGRGSQLDS